ncbi:uncharacterized protein LOC120493522 [Pimephales promelas]|uniref:uncharacterized protein LOC120493522 n=1 Tax=Pimephales promelas TaxID=90988 RepID=UPI0019559242|nr:uncharacterized protein LOC120493522 [Pimephales promelas]KAG1964675.1 hypothetical protein F2P79_004405 [Pimephales promelas]
MDSKDARECLESGDSARCRCGNGWRKALALFVIQGLLTAACAALSISIYLSQQPEATVKQDTGIYMSSLDLDEDEPRFEIIWNKAVDLYEGKKMKLPCGGPYMVYLWACMKSLKTNDVVANLTIETGNKSFHLQTLQPNECKEVQKVIMLSDKNNVTMKVGRVKGTIKITELLFGLHYMLGSQCFPNPLDDESYNRVSTG